MITDNSTAPMILVVEDDDSHADLIQRSFDEACDGYRLEIAGTLSGAWKIIEQRPPDLVLADYRLPDGYGNELVLMVNDACPVVLMTAQGNELLAVEAMKAGAQDYIVKSADSFVSMPRIVRLALQEWHIIQERRKIHEAVSRGKRDWERTFDAVPDLIAIIDLNHGITRVNKAMADRCGLKPEEIIGRRCCDVVHDLEHTPEICPVALMMQDGLMHTAEIRENMLNGIFDVTVSPLFDEDGRMTAFVHVMRDITQRLKLEQQFQQTQKLESLGVLASGIAHDFNNILTIILGYCHLSKEATNSELTLRQYFKQIEDAGGRAADLCQQMLAYAGKRSLLQAKVNLCLQIDEIVKMLTSAIKKNVAVEMNLKRNVPEIKGDSGQIQQIIMNLIINAAEAIGENSGTIKVALTAREIMAARVETDFAGNALRCGRYACLEVSDNGCGMDEATAQRIFEPFFTTKFTGRGLGMSAILGIIKSHDGALQLSSTPGSGTTFKVYFPLNGAVTEGEAATSVTTGFPEWEGKTILLVDDEQDLRCIGSALFSSIGFSVVTASNGREALEIYHERGNSVDLVLLDMIMPEMGGLETYKKFRKIAPDLPIIMCSGYDVDEFSKGNIRDHYVRVVQKPYKPDQIYTIAHNLLEAM